MATIMDGKALSAKVKAQVKSEIDSLNITPGLAVIIVGSDPASRVYVNKKKKDCEACGIASFEFALSESTSEEEILNLIEDLNKRDDVHGILCQLPLPAGISQQAVIQAISPKKDVDCFHFENVGRVMDGDYSFLPCTPAGVMELLEEYKINMKGKHAVVINRSNIVGKPQAMLLLHKDATITVCHRYTEDLASYTRTADVLVTAVGKENFITKEMIKPGAVVIDVSIVRRENGTLCGDVDYDAVSDVCSHITPVPGGVGPMTVAILMRNTLTSAKKHYGK